MRNLVASAYFEKRLKKFLLSHPDLERKTREILMLLSKDLFNPKLETHKLSGKLKWFYGASIDYHYRIVLQFNDEKVFLLNIGSHDEVY